MASDPFDWCAQEVRRHDPDRFLASLFASEEKRRHLFALFAFNLEVARIPERAREPLVAAMRLQFWRDAIEGIYVGTPPSHPAAEALAVVIARHGLPREAFGNLLDARAFDLTDELMANAAALDRYAAATSSSLMIIAVRILTDQMTDALAQAAYEGGRAWAYAGLLRSFSFHAGRRKLYVPGDWLGSDIAAYFARRSTPRLKEASLQLAERSEEALTRAQTLLRAERPGGALPAFLNLVLLPSMLKRFQRPDFDPLLDSAEPLRIVRLGRILTAGLTGRI